MTVTERINTLAYQIAEDSTRLHDLTAVARLKHAGKDLTVLATQLEFEREGEEKRG